MTNIIESIAEELWQEENRRVHNKPRSVPWEEAAHGEHERFRGMAVAAIRVLEANGIQIDLTSD